MADYKKTSVLALPDNDDTLPDPDMTKFHVGGPYIVVRPLQLKRKTAGGIILTDESIQDFTYIQTLGRVLKKSPNAYHEGVIGPVDWVNEGDIIGWDRTTGKKVMTGRGVLLVLLPYENVLYKVDEPDFIDTSGWHTRK